MQIIDVFQKIWSSKWHRRMIIGLGIAFLLSIPVRCHGPYKGRVVEENTGEPIAGVVVVATWSSVTPTVAGGTTHCLDAEEAVTDAKGEFIIKGSKGPFLGFFAGTMMIYIYKVGYKCVSCMWEVIDQAGSCYAYNPVERDGDIAIFPMKRVPKVKLNTAEGSPPFINCGPRNGKPLVEYNNVREAFRRAIKR
jgi:hypothetical protein